MHKTEDHLPRAEVGIFIGKPSGNSRGHKIYKFSTNTIVTRAKIKVIPPTDELLAKLKDMTSKEILMEIDEIITTDDIPKLRSVRDILEGSLEDITHPITVEEQLTEPDIVPTTVNDIIPTANDSTDNTNLQKVLPVVISRGETGPKLHNEEITTIHNTMENLVNIKHVDSHIELESKKIKQNDNPTRSSNRIKTNWKDIQNRKEHFGLNVSISRAIKTQPDAAAKAIAAELAQLHKLDVWEPVHEKDLQPSSTRLKAPTIMFLKEKYKPNGEFDKHKASCAVMSNVIDRVLFENISTSSPTVDISTVFTLLTIASHEGLHVSTCDIPGAFLKANLQAPDNDKQLDSSIR